MKMLYHFLLGHGYMNWVVVVENVWMELRIEWRDEWMKVNWGYMKSATIFVKIIELSKYPHIWNEVL